MSKCVKCGRELTSAEIPEFYNGMCEKCCKEKNYAEYPFKQGINDYQNQIDQLKQQLAEMEQEFFVFQEDSARNEQIYIRELAEKDEQINNLEQMCQICNKEQENELLKQQLAEKDKEINSLIVDYEKRISQEQKLMSNMEHLLTEKQNAIDEINKEFVQAVHDWKVLCAKKDEEIEMQKNLFELNNEVVINQGKEIFDLRVQVLQQKQNQTQLAIQELEKVKMQLKDKTKMMSNEEHCYQQKVVSWLDICNQTNNQIKELKGE